MFTVFPGKTKSPLTSGEWASATFLNYCLNEITRQMCRTRRTNNMSCSYTSASGEELSCEERILSSVLDVCQNIIDSHFFWGVLDGSQFGTSCMLGRSYKLTLLWASDNHRKSLFQCTKEESRVAKTRLPEKCPAYLNAFVKDGTFSVCFSRGNPRRSSIVASND